MADCEFISINPPIPLSCLNNFAGYVLRKTLTCTECIIDGKTHIEMVSRGERELCFEVDEEFIALFEATEAENQPKGCIIDDNQSLWENRIEVGQQLKMRSIYIEDFLQSIVSENFEIYPFAELILIPIARIYDAKELDGYFALISKEEIKRVYSREWFAAERLNTPFMREHKNRMPRALAAYAMREENEDDLAA